MGNFRSTRKSALIPIGLASSKNARARTLNSAFLTMLFFAFGGMITFAFIIGCSPDSTKDTQQAGAKTASQLGFATNGRPEIAPPKYRILYQHGAYPTTIAVPVGTTDIQLKSLLWHIRDGIRSRSYKELGLEMPSDLNHRYAWGTIEIYRGTKCASEEYTERSPCGTSEDHDAGRYTWGMDLNPDNDLGVIFIADKDRTRVQVFDGNDGYQLPADLKAKLDAKSQAAATEEQTQKAAQQLWASAMQESLQQKGFDVHVIAGPDKGQLVIGSHVFDNDFGRAQFLSDTLPKLKKELCKDGFTKVTLKSGLFSFGHTYRIGC